MRQPNPAMRNNLLRVVMLVAAFAVVLTIILLSLNAILPGFSDVLERGDQQELVHYIRGFGSVGGVALAFLLQFIQIISIFFPGGPIQIAIGVVFGTLWDSSSAMLDTFLQTSSCFIAQESLATDWINCFPKVEPKPHAFAF